MYSSYSNKPLMLIFRIRFSEQLLTLVKLVGYTEIMKLSLSEVSVAEVVKASVLLVEIGPDWA